MGIQTKCLYYTQDNSTITNEIALQTRIQQSVCECMLSNDINQKLLCP